jgi:hypothetical protein
MKTCKLVISASVFWLSTGMQAACADDNAWQMANLFDPSPAQLEREQQGRVMIYHGLKDTDVNRAMNEQFERLDTMMFTGTIVTDGLGRPLRDPVSGAVVVEDDGC